jgi:hypothetical protein
MNDSMKIIMCNNREFGVINEKSYLHYVSCAIMYIIYRNAEKVSDIFTTQLV